MRSKRRVVIGVSVVAVAMLLLALGSSSAIAGDTIWYLENSYGVCSSCHEDVKSGHMEQKKKCDRCHEPGAKKEVHNIPAVNWNVDDPDEWEAFCSYCHTDNKTGHMEKKKECLRCHGPGEKKDVHVEMAEVSCLTCHSEPVGGPQDHLDNCNACHGYM